MSTVTHIDSITYKTSTGTMTVTYDRPEWVVTDNGTTLRFSSVPEWMQYARETHGWPMEVAR